MTLHLQSTVLLCFILSVISVAPEVCGAVGDTPCWFSHGEVSEGQGISLLQHGALYKKSKVVKFDTEPFHRKTSIEDAATFPPRPGSKFSDKHSIKVVQGPRELLVTESCIVFFGAVVLCIFFWTEKVDPHAWMRQGRTVGKALDSRNFLALEEQLLQDFIIESDKPYIIAVDGRASLTYAQLHAFVESREVNVSRFGVSSTDRLASLLGNGPETAVAFWVFSIQCAFAPINDASTNEEIEFTLRDLPARAVLMRQADIQGRSLCAGVPILQYLPDPRIAGLFSLKWLGRIVTDAPEMETQVHATRSSVALVIQTAGTTKKPKLVPLTHENLILTCSTIAQVIELHPDDRALNVQPLFQIGGLTNNVIAPVIAHSSVVCAPHFTGQEAYTWIQKYRPTWFYGSPTNHILIMRGQEAPDGRVLRCIRSDGSALLPSTAKDMQRFWGCEILPAYGMAECTSIAGHQSGKLMCFSTVGPPAAPQISLGKNDEILVRGPSVFPGYEVRSHMETHPNEDSFDEGWFHTGDRGGMDESGYLSVTGRLKDVIFRGGEKIPLSEIEDAMVDARVQEKCAFPVIHEEFGEVVGLAVKTSVEDEHLGELLGSLKRQAKLNSRWLPEVIVKVDLLELPRGGLTGGKLKRTELQQHLGLPPRSLGRDDPIAYTFSDSGELTEVELEEGVTGVVDYLSLMRGQGGKTVPREDQNIILAMCAIAVFMIVSFQAQLYIQLPTYSYIAPAFTFSLGGNIIGGMRWTMQCLVASTSYLLCDEPFQITRVICLALLYFLLQWPITPIASWLSHWVSGEPPGSFFVLTDKRWFVLVMLISYVLFAGSRKLPCHGLHCFVLVLLTICLCIWPVSPHCISNVAPAWVNYWFDAKLTAGAYCWCGCLTTYFVVGHYGHRVRDRLNAHPLSTNKRVQQQLKVVSPFLFLGFVFITFLGCAANLARRNDLAGHAWVWDPFTLLMDQLAGLVMIGLLSQAVRFMGTWLSVVGRSSLGIYLGCNLVYFCPHAFSRVSSSFGIIIQKTWIVPPLQEVITTCVWCWPLQTLIILIYTCFQIIVFGIPFHWACASFFKIFHCAARKMGVTSKK